MKASLLILAALLRGLSALMSYWKPLLVILVLLSPVGPHIRWNHSYTGSPEHPRFTRCVYLGARGLITPPLTPSCPLIAWLDARKWAP